MEPHCQAGSAGETPLCMVSKSVIAPCQPHCHLRTNKHCHIKSIYISQLAEPLWTDPGIKSGICVRELIFTSNYKKKCRYKMNGRTFSPNPHSRGKSHHHRHMSFSSPMNSINCLPWIQAKANTNKQHRVCGLNDQKRVIKFYNLQLDRLWECNITSTRQGHFRKLSVSTISHHCDLEINNTGRGMNTETPHEVASQKVWYLSWW